MLRNLIKLGVLGVVAICSLETSSYYINQIVLEVEARQPTLTDFIIRQQVQESLKEAEKEIEQVVQEENIVIQQEVVQIKPAEQPKEPVVEAPIEVETVLTEEMDETLLQEDVVADNVTESVTPDFSTDDLLQYTELTDEDMGYVINYLIDNYFLFGERYYTVEEDPVRYERKKLANDMEASIIQSISELSQLASSLLSMKAADIQPILEETTVIATDFYERYQDVGDNGVIFQEVYEEGILYFEAYIRGLTNAVETFETIETTTNKALVLPMMLKRINQDILPAIRDVLNQGFAVKEKTNVIYLEGLDDHFLLTPQEVIAIIENPHPIIQEMKRAESEQQELPNLEAGSVQGEASDEVTSEELAEELPMEGEVADEGEVMG